MARLNLSLGSSLGERLRVELRPATVALVRWQRFPRLRVLATRTIAIEADDVQSEHPGEPWRASLDALAAGLREQRAAPGRVEVVLSDHFVRYALVPWSESLVGDSERLGFARLSFREVYGHVSDTWDVCLDEQPAGAACFACAVDRALLTGLRDVMSRVGARLEAVSPALADCLNRHRRGLKEKVFCLATAEPGRISLAFRSRTGWQAVRSRRVDGPLPETLPTLLKQEAAAGSAPDGGVLYLCAAGINQVPPFMVQGWRLVRLGETGVAAGPAAGAGLAAVRG
jgi:hypothetical protein